MWVGITALATSELCRVASCHPVTTKTAGMEAGAGRKVEQRINGELLILTPNSYMVTRTLNGVKPKTHTARRTCIHTNMHT